MTILRLHHVQITIPPDTEVQARQFYCELLGLLEIPKPESLQGRGGFWLQVGNQQVHIGTETGVERAHTKAHLAYEVEEIGAWRQRIQHQGIAILEGVPIPGCERFEFRDPFGNRIEFIQPLE